MLREKEKLLNMSNFSFTNSVFKRLVLLADKYNVQTRAYLEELNFNPFPHNDAFWRLWETSLLKTLWEKEKLLVTSDFSFSHSVFYPFG